MKQYRLETEIKLSENKTKFLKTKRKMEQNYLKLKIKQSCLKVDLKTEIKEKLTENGIK